MPSDPSTIGDLGGTLSDPYTQQLLDLAQQQGGAVAQTAGELVHPNGGFLSMAKDKLGNSFHNVMDTLATPEETIAAGMSQFTGHPESLKEAYNNHIQPSSVLFGSGAATTPAGKFAKFGTGFLTDTLLDPLTYVTTGTYSGMFGLSKLPSIPIGESTGRALGWTQFYNRGKQGVEAVRHATLSAEGAGVRAGMIAQARKTVIRDTLEKGGFKTVIGAAKVGAEAIAEGVGEFIPGVDIADTALIASQVAGVATKGGIELGTTLPGVGRFFSANNIRANIGKGLFQLAGKSPTNIMASMAIAATHAGADGAHSLGIEELAKLAKNRALVERPWADMTSAERDAWGGALNEATHSAMVQQATRLARHTLNAKEKDILLEVDQNMRNIIEKNSLNGNTVVDKFGKPVVDQFGNKQIRNLAQAWLDKGGVKVFGQSIVSGARIRNMMNMAIPAEDRLNQLLGPSAAKTLSKVSNARHMLSAMFSTKFNDQGRIPDTVAQIARNWKFKQDAQLHEFIQNTGKIMQRMAIEPDEMETAMNAVALGKRPAESPEGRLPALYDMLHSQQGNKVMEDIANGVYGSGTKPEDVKRMWTVANYVKKQLQQNLVMMRDAGMSVYEHENYVPLMLNETKKVLSPFLRTKSSQAVNAMKGEYNKFVNVEDGGKILYGTAEHAKDSEGNFVSLEQHNKAEERTRINSQIENTIEKSKTVKARFVDQIERLWEHVSDKQVKSIVAGSKGVIKGAEGDDLFNKLALEKVIREAVPEVDRNRILKEYAQKYYSESGAKLHGEPVELGLDDIKRLKEDMSYGDEDLDKIASYIKSHLDAFGIKVGKSPEPGTAFKASKDSYQQALTNMRDAVMESGINAKKQYLKDALNKPAAAGSGHFGESGMFEPDKQFKDVMAGLSEEWHKNPGAISKLLEGILGKNQDLNHAMSDLSDTKTGLENELKQPGLKRVDDRWFYSDSEGNTYERLRATAKEINDNYFDGDKVFSEDPLLPFLHATENTLRTVNSKYLLDSIATQFGVKASEAPSNYLSVSIASMADGNGKLPDFIAKEGANKKVESLMYHPAIAHEIVNMMRVMDKDPVGEGLLQSYDKLTNIFKVSVTAPFLAFHGRNAMSNVWQSMMDIGVHALSPAKHIMAMKLQTFNKQLEEAMLDLGEEASPEKLQKYFDIADKEIITDRSGRKWTVGELDRVLRDNVVAYNPSILGMMDAGLTTEERFNQISEQLYAHTDKWGAMRRSMNPLSQKFLPYVQGRNLSNYMESEPRILNFLANLENTGDVAFAAHQTKLFLYDHTNLTPFERNFMRRVIPFYAYTRKNLEAMVQTMIHKPGRVDWFRNTYTNIGDAFAGGNLSREERDLLPEWMRDSLDMVVARNGSNAKIITSLGSPFEAPFDELGIGSLFGAMNPIIKGPVENATGYSFFEGKPLSQVTDATAFKNAPRAIKDLIGFTTKTYTDSQGTEHTMYVSMNPRMMNVFNNLPLTSRTLSSLTLIQNPNIDTQNKILANLLGIKPTAVDLEEEQFQRQKELDAELQQILSSAGVGYTRTEYTAPTGTHLVMPPTNPENQ